MILSFRFLQIGKQCICTYKMPFSLVGEMPQSPKTMKMTFHGTTPFGFFHIDTFTTFHNFCTPFRFIVWNYFLKIFIRIRYIQDAGKISSLWFFPIFWTIHELKFTLFFTNIMVIYLYLWNEECTMHTRLPSFDYAVSPPLPVWILHKFLLNTLSLFFSSISFQICNF